MSRAEAFGNLLVNHPGEMSVMAVTFLALGFIIAAYRCMMCGGKKDAREVTND